MHVHPEIAALRGDKPAQRRIQAAMRGAQGTWRARSDVAEVARELDEFAGGADLSDCPVLASMFRDHTMAMAFVLSWLEGTLGALMQEPLGEVPHRYRCSPGLASLQLMQVGGAALSLAVYERRANVDGRMPESVLFADRESHELVLEGSAEGTLHRLEADRSGPPMIETSHARWKAGDTISLSGPGEARQVVRVQGAMVLLQLTRTPSKPGPSREYRLSDCALLQSASGDKGASQRFMALSVLGALEHAPAVDVFEQCALNRNEDADVRWEAVRQALVMEPARGISLLERLRSSKGDALAFPAAELAKHLIATQPELAPRAVSKA